MVDKEGGQKRANHSQMSGHKQEMGRGMEMEMEMEMGMGMETEMER